MVIKNFIDLLIDNGVVSDPQAARLDVSKHVRWVRANMPSLELLRVSNGVYLVEADDFKKEFSAFLQKRKTTASNKRSSAKLLNQKIQEEKSKGLRDRQGRLPAAAKIQQKQNNKTETPQITLVEELLSRPMRQTSEQALAELGEWKEAANKKVANYSSKAAKERQREVKDIAYAPGEPVEGGPGVQNVTQAATGYQQRGRTMISFLNTKGSKGGH